MTQPSSQVALVTGTSRGLGLALARTLAQRGWALILDARHADTLAAVVAELAPLTKVKAVVGSNTDEVHRRALRDAAQELGGLDVVVNNAGILGPSPQVPLLNYPLEILEEVYRINTVASLGILQAVRNMLRPGARVINVTSDAGVVAYPNWGGYGSSKAALEQISAVLAVENPWLRVYWVDPGDMRTQMHQEAFPSEDISDRPLPDESAEAIANLIESALPSGRYSTHQLAEAVQPLQTV